MNFIVLTVTYGDRERYLIKVIDELVRQKVQNLVIVFNGCSEEIVTKITSKYADSIKIHSIINTENEGSAGGFHQGLEYIRNNKNNISEEKVLILDDDNLIPEGLFDNVQQESIEEKDILWVVREDRGKLLNARFSGNPCINISTKNSFLGIDVFKKVFPQYEKTQGEIICVPYSGMIFNKNILDNHLPNVNYYLYGDDYEFSYKLSMEEGCHIRIYDSLSIKDLETSFHLLNKRKKITNRYSNASITQLYYSVRNQVIFSKLRVQNKFIYFVNFIIIFCAFNISFLLSLDFKKIFYFNLAIYDGLIGKSGKNRHYKSLRQ